jgi:hypothetical protein
MVRVAAGISIFRGFFGCVWAVTGALDGSLAGEASVLMLLDGIVQFVLGILILRLHAWAAYSLALVSLASLALGLLTGETPWVIPTIVYALGAWAMYRFKQTERARKSEPRTA